MSSPQSTYAEVSESEDSDDDFDRKPRLPYVKGFTMTAWRHEPPKPFGFGYDTEDPSTHGDWKALSQLQYCLSCSPLGGHIRSEESKPLTITSTIRTGYNCGAQLVVVDDTMVAKIYDPLYYDCINDFGKKEDVVQNADGDYSREAAAYEVLQLSPTAKAVTPAFYGTWTTEIETLIGSPGQQEKHVRLVRLILIERLHGDCMDDIDPGYLRKSVRSLILKKVLEAEAIIFQAGIKHRDFCTRNIMIISSNYEDASILTEDLCVEVRVLDFNIAKVIDQHKYRACGGRTWLLEEKWHPRLLSPIVRFYGHMAEFSVDGWCSCEDRDAEQWLWKHFHWDKRYIPVVWDPNTPDIHPEYEGWSDLENSSDSSISLSRDTAMQDAVSNSDNSSRGSG